MASSCSSGGDDALGPTATVGTAPTTTATAAPVEAPPDPSVIPADPADIDEEYVQAVVDALFAVDAKATEIFVKTEELDEEGVDYLEAIYIGEELDQQVNVWSETFAHGSEALLPGALDHKVTRLIGRGSDCVYFEAEVDFAKTTTRKVPPQSNFLGITPKASGDDPKGENPTAWMLFTDGINEDGSMPEDPCAGR